MCDDTLTPPPLSLLPTTSFEILEKIQVISVISLYWFVAQRQTSTMRR